MDLINCLAYVSNQLTGSPPVDADLQRYRQLLKEQIDSTPRASIDGLTYAQDGVLYKDGYRVESFDENRLDALNARIRDLEQTSREKEAKLEQLNEKLQELESHSEEEDIPRDRSRSRSVSRELSPQPSTSSGCVPQIVLDENDMRGGSKKFRPIHRDDEFRRTIKKQSVKSNASEDRADELDLLTQMEEEENKVMDDYIPLVYTREEQMAQGNKRHQISPIQELCHMHENDERLRMERSPEPAFGAETVKPWGDIRLGETKEKEIIHLPQNQLIEEERKGSVSSSDESLGKREDTDQWQRNSMPELPIVQQEAHLTVSEPISSNISSHSGSPDPEHPTLKRTRKKSDLTALLLEEERKDATNSGITIQTEDSENENVNTTEFMQCKSPSPYVENENLEVPCQLIPLIGADLDKSPASESRQSSVSQDSLQPSATQSRDATISPAPIGSSGSPASPNSSILDESFKEHSGDNRNSSSPIESDKNNVSRDGSVSLASTDTPAASLGLHGVDQQLRTPSPEPPPPPEHVVDLDAGGVDRKSDHLTPPSSKRFRMRTRKIRSLTPIEYNQSFMDDFIEQRLSVSPSELEDYITSLEEIKFDPPKPVVPNFFLPTTPMTSGLPNLIVTDERGADAQFHDSISSKGFYGNCRLTPNRIPNHRVSYSEWIKKFPENTSSHLELEDYDSDDEEVESIFNNYSSEPSTSTSPEVAEDLKFPVNLPEVLTPIPEPPKDLPTSPEVTVENRSETPTEFPLNVIPSYATPSPTSQISDLSLSSESNLGPFEPQLKPAPSIHFTPITSHPENLSPTPDPHSLSPRLTTKLYIPSRSTTSSPIPSDMTPEEAIYDIGHLDGLIFETKSRSPTPAALSPVLPDPLSPEELAFDIGNLGGLILGPPSRSTSPLPPSASPTTPGSSPWSSTNTNNKSEMETTPSPTPTHDDSDTVR
ncbi:cell surface glycoprotein 1 isoform X2 [Uranotaenia lowii]|nr:cell surface glycoprotein 1 isoform X2 [Uranotaenia lowii]